jgi:hypothetical protein
MLIDVLLGGLVWGVVGYSIWRGYRRAEHVDRYMLVTWTIFVAVAVAFTLRMRALHPVIDGRFAGYPVARFLNLQAVLVATAAYALSLRWLMARSPQIYRLRSHHSWLLNAAPVIALLLAGAMSLMVVGVSSTKVRSMMQWAIEGYGMLQSMLLFVPVNVALLRHEQVFSMRVKHLAAATFCFVFAITGALSFVLIPLAAFSDMPGLRTFSAVRGPMAALCLVVILVPHRWLTLLLLPRQLHRYVRLAALERHIERLVPIRRETLVWSHLFDPEQMEMAIYVTAINILDHYRRVNSDHSHGSNMVAQIEALWPKCASYDDLVEGLCRIRL